MTGGTNLAAKYASKVDERFNRESQAMLGCNSDYKFTGVDTVNVYSIPTVPMVDYVRNGNQRYGQAVDLARNVQTMKLSRDRAFTFIIDRGDYEQTAFAMEAGKALGRETKEVWVPEFDSYVFRKMAYEATKRKHYSTAAITAENAYKSFLDAMEYMGDRNVPEKGRVAFCSYKYANLLKLDPSFIKTGDSSQEMLSKGVIGEVDGCKIVKVPSSKLPSGCAFILCHKSATCAPKQLQQFKTHNNPPGISGWLVEGRVIYDAFVLNEKADGIFYHGSQPVLRTLDVQAADLGDGNVRITVNPEAEDGCSWFYKIADDATEVSFGTTVADWTKIATNGTDIAHSNGGVITVVEADESSTAKAVGTAILPSGRS